MNKNIGQIIKKVATEKGLSQKELGDRINRTKQGIASIYKRSTIDMELLKEISKALNHNFLSYYYEEEPFKTFNDVEISYWEGKIEILKEQNQYNEKLIEKNEEILLLQRKYIAELENKLKIMQTG